MSLKTKLLTTISLMCLTVVMLMVGVWAVKTAEFKVGGNINFTATGINATISKGTLAGGTLTNSANKLKAIELNTDKTQSQIESEFASWSNLDLSFNENGDDVTITFAITNNEAVGGKSIIVNTAVDNGTAQNASVSINNGTVKIAPQTTVEFVITFTVTDKTANASLTGFEISCMIEFAEPINLLHDTTNDYYYVEMGTYNGEPVRWKVVGVNGNHYTYNETQAPTGELSFILETKTTYCEFGALYYNDETGEMRENSDYSTSVVRQYITGHDCALLLTYEGYEDYQVNKNYLNDINIDSTIDNVYKQIKTRSIPDLYNTEWRNPTTTEGSDKLWIPSVSEVYSLVGGGDISIIPDSWAQEIQNKTAWSMDYWTRSFNGGQVYVNKSGDGVGGAMCDASLVAVRPMFLLEV